LKEKAPTGNLLMVNRKTEAPLTGFSLIVLLGRDAPMTGNLLMVDRERTNITGNLLTIGTIKSPCRPEIFS